MLESEKQNNTRDNSLTAAMETSANVGSPIKPSARHIWQHYELLEKTFFKYPRHISSFLFLLNSRDSRVSLHLFFVPPFFRHCFQSRMQISGGGRFDSIWGWENIKSSSYGHQIFVISSRQAPLSRGQIIMTTYLVLERKGD